jgi:hypothetical protein
MILATFFRDCVDILGPIVMRLEEMLWLRRPWMNDPISIWARLQFNQYFAEGPHAFAKIVQDQHDQHVATTMALVSAAKRYGMTEELIAAGFMQQGGR